jgi:hypothetical protein
MIDESYNRRWWTSAKAIKTRDERVKRNLRELKERNRKLAEQGRKALQEFERAEKFETGPFES